GEGAGRADPRVARARGLGGGRGAAVHRRRGRHGDRRGGRRAGRTGRGPRVRGGGHRHHHGRSGRSRAPGPRAPRRGRAVTSPRTVAVVPLRDGVSGKSRLAAALDPGARRRLVVALARHVVEVLAPLVADGRLAGVVVATADVPFVKEVLA